MMEFHAGPIAEVVARIADDPRRARDWRRLVAEARLRSFWDSRIRDSLDYSYWEWAQGAHPGASEEELSKIAVVQMVASCVDQRSRFGDLRNDPVRFRGALAAMLGLRSRGIFLLRTLVGEAAGRRP